MSGVTFIKIFLTSLDKYFSLWYYIHPAKENADEKEKTEGESVTTITKEMSLREFPFWSGAEDNASLLTLEELDQLEEVLEELAEENGEPFSETEVNDIMWVDSDFVATACTSYDDWEELYEDRHGKPREEW